MSGLFRSLRWRLVIGLLVPLVSLRLLSGYLNLSHVERYGVSFQDQSLSDVLLGTTVSPAPGTTAAELNEIRAIFDVMAKRSPDDFLYQIRSPDGQILAGDPGLPSIEADRNIRFASFQRGTHQFRAAAVTIPYLENATVEIANNVSKLQEIVDDSWSYILSLQILMAILIIFVVHGVIQIELKPLKALRKDILSRRLYDMKSIESVSLPSEIVPVVETLNELFSRLKLDIEKQQSFFELVSHQLKTPIAGMRNLLEIAKRERVFAGHPETEHNIRACVDRMDSLCQKLLSLVRVTTSAEFQKSIQPLQLGSLCKDAIISLIPHAEAKSIDLGFQFAEGEESEVTVQANREALAELITILIDNAIRYSPPETSVNIIVGNEPAPRIIVEDQGQGIPNEYKEQIFERFFRMLGNSEPGSGLGLAIAREIAKLQHAKLFVTDSEGGGARFVVEFEPQLS